jgi:hypothetical protein
VGHGWHLGGLDGGYDNAPGAGGQGAAYGNNKVQITLDNLKRIINFNLLRNLTDMTLIGSQSRGSSRFLLDKKLQ